MCAKSNVRFGVGFTFSLVLAVTLASTALGDEPGQVDPALPNYSAKTGVSGNLKSVGSDTMNNEMALWTEGFRKFYPNVKIEVEGKGSGTAPPALTEGTAHFGAMSRAMKSKEEDEFESRHGYKPAQIRTSID